MPFKKREKGELQNCQEYRRLRSTTLEYIPGWNMFYSFRFLFLSIITCFYVLGPSCSQLQYPCKPPYDKYQFCDTSHPIKTRAKSLISLLTLDEKIQQLSDNATQISRLGIPAYEWWSESLHGIATNGPGISFNGTIQSATGFPQVILTAAAFNRTLWREIAKAVAVEARAMYNLGQAGLTFFAPNINIFRDPRWGRGQETPGEDPMVTSAYAIEYVRGFQGQNQRGSKHPYRERRFLNDDDQRSGSLMLSACCKHYTAYDLEKWGGHTRYDFDAKVTNQDMEDTYQPPFKSCIVQGRASCLMCSYNRVNGIPACADRDLLHKARNDWGFKGYITSDCDAVATIFENNNFTKTKEEAVAVALKAGTDINCGTYMLRHMKSAIDQGKVLEEDIDRALFNLFSVLLQLGLFDGNPARRQFGNLGSQNVCSSEHKTLALEAAMQGIVLLKNNQKFLPWNKNDVSSVAIIGPMANTTNIGGDYTGFSCNPESILQGLKNYVKDTFYAAGCQDVPCNSTAGIPEALSIAKEAEYVIVVAGLDLSQETEDLDRYSLLLPGHQMALIRAVASVSKKPVVLVLTGGGPVDVSFAEGDQQIASIIWIGYPGETGGKALSQILFGEYNPGGRLPMTWYPESFTSIPMTDMSMRADPSRGYPGRTYRFYTGERVYGFGHGLSYTNFNYKILSAPERLSLSGQVKGKSRRYILQGGGNGLDYVHVDDVAYCDSLRFYMQISIINNGDIDGSQVVLLFSQVPKSFTGAPEKQIVGFDRVHALAYRSVETSILVDPCEHLSIVNEQGRKILPLGDHTLMVEDLKHTLSIEA
ncbi:probable beta-D-xylosidase 6 [Coffea arabica]|uniref:Probable beta-D-xylosidase 6 n=1 Tax=Coffea arabica TaxID=13443 RepID=A0A6P6U3M7_COFAR|nr:probable beta-D-xylosidase 6 isoform X1 [Coffea arabica]